LDESVYQTGCFRSHFQAMPGVRTPAIKGGWELLHSGIESFVCYPWRFLLWRAVLVEGAHYIQCTAKTHGRIYPAGHRLEHSSDGKWLPVNSECGDEKQQTQQSGLHGYPVTGQHTLQDRITPGSGDPHSPAR